MNAIIFILITVLFGSFFFLFGFIYATFKKTDLKEFAKSIYKLCPNYLKKVILKLYSIWINYRKESQEYSNHIHKILDANQEEQIAKSISIGFIGDLLLLRQMVERAYNEDTTSFSFDEMFLHVTPIIKKQDYTFGVFEGPVSKNNKFSTSNYGDGIPLYLNFPKEFAESVKKAGIDFVTTANNHLLDQGINGYYDTLDTLDLLKIEHTGSYRNQTEHDKIKIINIKGIRIGVLAYTYGSNYYEESFFFKEENKHITDLVVNKQSKFLKQAKANIKQDFDKLKTQHVDIIVVLPHMGTQFKHHPDNTQKMWCNYFIEQGADIIFSDHCHAVQPIEWKENCKGDKVLIIHCPGNYINSYIQYDGDASYIAEVYISPVSKKPFASSCIPIYTYAKKNGLFTGIPIYNIAKEKDIDFLFSTIDYNRVKQVHSLVTNVAIGQELSIDQVQKKYYYYPDNCYYRHRQYNLENRKTFINSALYKTIEACNEVCFIGDSITEGSKNGGYGWYEPLMGLFPNKKYTRFAICGATTLALEQFAKEIQKQDRFDLYVVAIGCNDIRYRNPQICAMDSTEFVKRLSSFVDTIYHAKKNTNFVFVSPFESYDYDPYCKCNIETKEKLYIEFTQALQVWCNEQNHLLINPNPYINSKRLPYNWDKYMKDHIHPNADEGIKLFSEAVLM